MTAEPDTVGPNDSLREVMMKMNRDGCRHLPVLDEGRLIGVVTDRDVRLAVNSPVLEEGEELYRADVLDRLDVQSCMTPDPMTVAPDTPASEAADMLRLHKFGGLPVMQAGRLVGIITTIDYLRHVAQSSER